MNKITVLLAVLLLGVGSFCSAEEPERTFAVGLGYPYLAVKYALGQSFAVEGRGAFETGIKVYVGRLYYNLKSEDKAVIYTGIEGDYITFEIGGTTELKWFTRLSE